VALTPWWMECPGRCRWTNSQKGIRFCLPFLTRMLQDIHGETRPKPGWSVTFGLGGCRRTRVIVNTLWHYGIRQTPGKRKIYSLYDSANCPSRRCPHSRWSVCGDM
jgi:hypothetical protein